MNDLASAKTGGKFGHNRLIHQIRIRRQSPNITLLHDLPLLARPFSYRIVRNRRIERAGGGDRSAVDIAAWDLHSARHIPMSSTPHFTFFHS